MTIICGTDFSEGAAGAVRVATSLARRSRQRLVLVHAVLGIDADLAIFGGQDGRDHPARTRLRELAEEIRATSDIEIENHVLPGDPDETIADAARRAGASMIVISSLGHRKPGRWLLGSVAERTAQLAPVPVLVVRSPQPFEGWLRGQAPLRILLATDLSEGTKAVLRFAAKLRTIGRCRLTVGHVSFTGATQRSPGEVGRGPDAPDGVLDALRSWTGEPEGEDDLAFVVRPGRGPTGNTLAAMAAETNADLVLVGAHRRATLGQRWYGSTSRAAISLCETNVLCVPEDRP